MDGGRTSYSTHVLGKDFGAKIATRNLARKPKKATRKQKTTRTHSKAARKHKKKIRKKTHSPHKKHTP